VYGKTVVLYVVAFVLLVVNLAPSAVPPLKVQVNGSVYWPHTRFAAANTTRPTTALTASCCKTFMATSSLSWQALRLRGSHDDKSGKLYFDLY